MTMRRASSVRAARNALIERLRARPGLADTLILATLPSEVPVQRERIYFLGVQELVREPRIQQGARRETYVLPVVVEVHEPTDEDGDLVDTRFWEIVEEIEADLADNAELANLADDSEVEQIPEMNVLPTTDGWIAKGLLLVRVNGIV